MEKVSEAVKKRHSSKKNTLYTLCLGGESRRGGISIQKQISLDFIWTGALLGFRGMYTAVSLTSVSGPYGLISIDVLQFVLLKRNGCAECRKFGRTDLC